MAKVLQAGPIDEKSLRGLKARGISHPLIDLRLEYAEKAQLLNHYIGPAAGRPVKDKKRIPWLKPDGRCCPNMMPTQASGRWSTTDPPLATFPPDYRRIVVPDPGWVWVVWDFDAIEARIVAAETNDQEDLRAFREGLDLHTITAVRIWPSLGMPPNLKDPHGSPECEAWRLRNHWAGKDDRRRHMAKTARYALFYALDHKGILNVKDVEKLGASREELLRLGYDYLQSKPNLVARKRQAWEQCLRTRQAVTAFGRVRPLMGDKHDVMKEGWSHMVSGTATDILNAALIAVDTRWPGDGEAVLRWQSHDSATIGFPMEMEWWPEIRGFVERTYTIAGHAVPFTASWKVIPPGGHTHNALCLPQRCHDWTPEEWFGGERDHHAEHSL